MPRCKGRPARRDPRATEVLVRRDAPLPYVTDPIGDNENQISSHVPLSQVSTKAPPTRAPLSTAATARGYAPRTDNSYIVLPSLSAPILRKVCDDSDSQGNASLEHIYPRLRFTSVRHEPGCVYIDTFDAHSDDHNVVRLPHVVQSALASAARMGRLAIAACTESGRLALALALSKQENDAMYAAPTALLAWALAGGTYEELNDDEEEEDVEINPQWAYEAVQRGNADTEEEDEERIEYMKYMPEAERNLLKVSLRKYQKRAVAWMLSKECGHRKSFSNWKKLPEPEREAFEALRKRGADIVQEPVYVDLVSGEIAVGGTPSTMENPVLNISHEGPSPHGGLLCDEMGLGKTVELLQVVAANRADDIIGQPVSKCVEKEISLAEKRCAECEKEILESRNFTCAECKRSAHERCLRTDASSAQKMGFVCTSCCTRLIECAKGESPAPRSNATLIIVPETLLSQWTAEIKRLTDSRWNVVKFRGLKFTGYIPQERLLNADVVLTTFAALRCDVSYARALLRSRWQLRHPQKYRPTPTPLLAIHWWRVAIDEAQMLGKGATSAIEMTSQLHTFNTWCVTGTPMSRSVGDLVPIFKVLRCGPVFRTGGFNANLVVPAMENLPLMRENLQNVLRRLMWRTEADGLSPDELGIPKQTAQVVRVDFGPVERYHYNALYDRARQVILSGNERRNAASVAFARQALHCLRQACCHPQVGTSGQQLMATAAARMGVQAGQRLGKRRRVNAGDEASKRAKNPLSMDTVLDMLVMKARLECQDALRFLVLSANGLAACCLLQQEKSKDSVDFLVTAIGLYRDMLRLAEENERDIKLDKIQRMHILHNLDEALSRVPELRKEMETAGKGNQVQALCRLGKTLREATLQSQVAALKKDVMSNAQALLTVATADYEQIVKEVENKKVGPHRKRSSEIQWWERAIGVIKDSGEAELFIDKLVRALLEARGESNPGRRDWRTNSIASRIHSLFGLLKVIPERLDAIPKARDALREIVQKLPGAIPPTEHQVFESGQCQFCRQDRIGPACTHCRQEKYLRNMQRAVYFVREDRNALRNGRENGASASWMTDDFIDAELDDSDDDDDEALETTAPQAYGRAFSNMDAQTVKTLMFRGTRKSSRRRDEHITNDIEREDGSRTQNDIEIVLRAVLGAARSKLDEKDCLEAAEFLNCFRIIQKEFLACKRVFQAQRTFLGEIDEINNMALRRLSVAEPGTDYSNLTFVEKSLSVPADVLPSLNTQFTADKKTGEMEFRSKRGSLTYLLSLQRSRDDEAKGKEGLELLQDARKCAVCWIEFNEQVAVLGCGHGFCYDCALFLIRKIPIHVKQKNISCPTCRKRTLVEEVNFTTLKKPATKKQNEAHEMEIDTRREGSSEKSTSADLDNSDSDTTTGEGDVEDEIQKVEAPAKSRASENTLSGTISDVCTDVASTFYDASITVCDSMGAKLSAIVRVLKKIENSTPDAKSLVFSQWDEVLDIISLTLSRNGIGHMGGKQGWGTKAIGNAIIDFKEANGSAVLLLPIRRAGAGLNITEATHVLLVEPSLNPALEAQAVGRIHRIGQTKPTFVHRFLVNSSIEDRVREIASVHDSQDRSLKENIEPGELLGLFKSESTAVNANRERQGAVQRRDI